MPDNSQTNHTSYLSFHALSEVSEYYQAKYNFKFETLRVINTLISFEKV